MSLAGKSGYETCVCKSGHMYETSKGLATGSTTSVLSGDLLSTCLSFKIAH